MRLLEARNLTLGYEGQEVVRDIDFTLEEGNYLCIVGDNGAGKSTLVKAILGLIRPMSGSLDFHIGKGGIGYLPQQSGIQRDFPSSVLEVVLSGCLNRHRHLFGYTSDEKRKALYELGRLGMDGCVGASFQDLSGGQQQRVLLARALMATEKLLLLDEPVTGLDPRTTSELYDIVDELNRGGITIMMVTHDIHPALNDARTILHLSQGRYFFGPKESYFGSDLGKVFMKEAGHDHR